MPAAVRLSASDRLARTSLSATTPSKSKMMAAKLMRILQSSYLPPRASMNRRHPMKFIELKSRGGNYLVVAENVAWLRDYENGQTQVGMVGGAPLLVAGKIEDRSEEHTSELQSL